MMIRRPLPLRLSLVLALQVVATATVSAQQPAAATAPQYDVQCPAAASAAETCTVSKETYFGWRTYAANCQVCHGGSGMGSTFAPNLLERFNSTVDYARFLHVLENGFTGQIGAMPGWKSKRDVMSNADNLYRYLRARADNKLPAGRPNKAAP